MAEVVIHAHEAEADHKLSSCTDGSGTTYLLNRAAAIHRGRRQLLRSASWCAPGLGRSRCCIRSKEFDSRVWWLVPTYRS